MLMDKDFRHEINTCIDLCNNEFIGLEEKFFKQLYYFTLNRLSNGSNIKVQQERVCKATHKLIFLQGKYNDKLGRVVRVQLSQEVELSDGLSCQMGRVVSWVYLSCGSSFSWVELSQGQGQGRVVMRVELSHGSS